MITITDRLIQLNNERLDAITRLVTKGIVCNNNATFTELINLLELASVVDTSDATATASDIVQNKIGYGADGKLMGTRAVNGTWTIKEQLDITNTPGDYVYISGRNITKYITYVGDTAFPNLGSADNLFGFMPSLEVVGNIKLPVSKSVYMLFHSSTRLKKIGLIDADLVTNCDSAFDYYGSGRMFIDLTDFKGFKNLGKGFPTTTSEHSGVTTLDLTKCPALTHESLVSIIHWLYDLTGIGVARQYLKLHPNCKARLSAAEIAIATQKGWDVE